MESLVIEAPLSILPALPLLGAFLAYLLGAKWPRAAGIVATAAALTSFIGAVLLVNGLEAGQIFEERLFSWIAVSDLQVPMLFRLDALTAVMVLVVTGVGSLIHLYSTAYMGSDPSQPRFFSYLNLFLFAMLTLVLGGNLAVMFIGWEGVGLCSYLLIGFWFTNVEYAKAGRKAFVVNRIGDAGFLLAMFLLYKNFGKLDFVELGAVVRSQPELVGLYTAVGLALFVAACGKSAQIPLYVWLPDAMAGPTPVSALIHAATMVTAGVYLLARMHFLFDLAPAAVLVVASIAALTALFAALIATTQNDIKKVLAYSTVSQLGFMFLGIASGVYWVAIFHLVTHAFFKACLFLAAGSVIYGCHHEQDLRKLGGLLKSMPVTAISYAIATLSIAGVAPFAGYYSKHAILNALQAVSAGELAVYAGMISWAASLAAFFTAFYMTRSFVLAFLGEYRGEHPAHESPWQMTSVLVVLALLALVGGVLLGATGLLPHYLSEVFGPVHLHGSEGVLELLLNSWIGFLGIGTGLVLYLWKPAWPQKIFSALGWLGRLCERKFLIDEIYSALIVEPLKGFANLLAKGVDKFLIDGAVNGAGLVCGGAGECVRLLQSGQIRTYALWMLAATVSLIAVYVLY